MKTRNELSEKLKKICPNVYFITGNTGAEGSIKYPAIVYNLTRPQKSRSANSNLYIYHDGYNVTYMDRTTRNVIKDFVESFDYCTVDSIYTSDGIHHQRFTIYL